MLPAQGLGMLFGPSGTGKTFWGLDIACHIHNGVKWRDKDVVKGDVMYIAAEASRGIKKRFQAVKRVNPDWVMPFVADSAPNLSELSSIEAVRDAARLVGKPAAIIIDTLSASFEGDDSSQQDIAKMLRNLKILSDDLDCLVLFIHHTTKDGGSWRGSGVLFNDVDAVLETVSEGDGDSRKLWVSQRKHKEGEAGRNYPFKLSVSDPLATKPNGKPITSCTVEQEDYTPAPKTKTKTRADDFATSERHSKARHYLSIIQQEVGLDGADIDEKGIVRAIQADKVVNPLCEEGYPRADNIKRTLLTLAEKGKIKLEGRWIRLCE
jgi:KaiC/GvpD/RAD55 family RecA-like ATPase